ncbi:hypothetical protein BOX15_Mlig008814g1 [Macrostomum lignano]|uniref:SH3 domain-containing protein n=1 Tax=Macrostomum lignano TaxID=282301 RepID=A0A267EC91_9PLAT|nr:hypothetical protein BOX15_Mlig008814g1 [Macrostomum lignano]
MTATSTWDNRLWDTYNPQLYNFTKYNIDFLKHCSDFLERRCKIEEKYAKEIKKLCKEFKPKDFDKREKFKFTAQTAFEDSLSELTALANQHENLRDDLLRSSRELRDWLREMNKQEQLVERRLAASSKDVERSRAQLEQARAQYHKAHSDMRRAWEEYAAAKESRDVTRAEEERLQLAYRAKADLCEDRRNGYAKEITEFNTVQADFIQRGLPEQLSGLEQLHRSFCDACSREFGAWAQAQLDRLAVQASCAKSLQQRALTVSADGDVAEFLRVTASGNPLPGDAPFEDLSASAADGSPAASALSADGDSVSLQHATPPRSHRAARLFSTLRSSKALGPAQQKRKLEEQLKDKEADLQKAMKEIEGLKKLRQTYQHHPETADQTSLAQVDAMLQQLVDKATRLRDECAEILDLTSCNGGGGADPQAASVGQPVKPMRKSRSISSLASGGDKKRRFRLDLVTRHFSPSTSASSAACSLKDLEGKGFGGRTGAGVMSVSATDGGAASPATAFADEFADESPQHQPTPQTLQPPVEGAAAAAPAAATAEMLYDFADTSQSDNLAVSAGEQVEVLQRDPDWSLVRRLHGEAAGEQGYVPTAYYEYVSAA